MSLTSSTLLAGLCAALGLAWFTGGATGNGIAAGFATGAASALSSAALQRRIGRDKPQFLIHTLMAGFLFKAGLLLVLALSVRYVEPLARVIDALSFVVAFAVAAILVLVPATFEMLRMLTRGGPARGPLEPHRTWEEGRTP